MSDNQQLTITLTGRDGLSKVFKVVGAEGARAGADIAKGAKSGAAGLDGLEREALATGKAIDLVGRESAATGREMGVLGTSADRASSSLAKGRAAGAALGATVGALSGVMSEATRAFAESQAIQATLETQIEATGKSYEEYADRIDAATAAAMQLAFDDELVAQSLTKLTSITNDAGESLDLLGLAMDVARGTGMDLVAASQLVGRVSEGNVGILQRYGIVVEAGASAQEALATMQTRFAGQAESYGETQSAVFDRIQISLGNFMESVGGSAGAITPLLMVLPGVSAGVTGIGAAAGVAGPGLLNMGKAAATARVGLLGMSLALGPIGIGLAVAGAAVGIAEATGLINIFGNEASAAEADTLTLARGFDELEASIAGVNAENGMLAFAQAVSAQFDQIVAGSEEANAALAAVGLASPTEAFGISRETLRSWNDLSAVMQDTGLSAAELSTDTLVALGVDPSVLASWDELNRVIADLGIDPALIDGFDEMGNRIGVATDLLGAYSDQLGDVALSGEQTAAVQADLLAILQTQDLNLPSITSHLMALFAAEEAGTITSDELATAIHETAEEAFYWTEGAIAAREAAGSLGTEVNVLAGVMGDFASVSEQARLSGEDELDIWQRKADQGDAYAKQMVRIIQTERMRADQEAASAAATESYIAAKGKSIAQMIEVQQAAEELAETYRSALVPGIEGLTNGLAAAIGPGNDMLDVLTELADVPTLDFNGSAMAGYNDLISDQADAWLRVADNVNDAGQAMDGTLSLYGVIDGFSSRLETAAGIANDLFGADGNAWDGIGPLTDLLNSGRIGMDQFNASVAAGMSIQQSAAEAELALNDMRSDQLPLLADQAAQYAAMLDDLANLTPAQQQLALAMQDAGYQAKVAEASSLAYSAAMGELGDNGEATAAQIIAGAAAADPILAALYEDIGLISTDHEGNLTVNFPDGESMVTVTENLNNSIRALIETLGGEVPPLVVGGDASGAVAAAGVAEGARAGVDGTSATVHVLGNESEANNALARAVAALAGVDGDTGTVYVHGDESNANTALGRAVAALAGVDGQSATVTIYGDDSPLQAVLRNVPQGGVVGTGVVWIEAQGPGIGYTPYQHGGIVGYQHGGIHAPSYAQHGITGANEWVWTGEHGPELVKLPVGSQVINSTASAAMAGPGGEPSIGSWSPSGDPSPLYGKTGIEDAVTLPANWGGSSWSGSGGRASVGSGSDRIGAPSTRATRDGMTFNFTNNGTIWGIDDMTAFLADSIGGILADEIDAGYREIGAA